MVGVCAYRWFFFFNIILSCFTPIWCMHFLFAALYMHICVLLCARLCVFKLKKSFYKYRVFCMLSWTFVFYQGSLLLQHRKRHHPALCWVWIFLFWEVLSSKSCTIFWHMDMKVQRHSYSLCGVFNFLIVPYLLHLMLIRLDHIV